MEQLQIIGAIKIKDGLFMGDEYSAQDLDFMLTNKITQIINCAGKQIPNIWESVNINYLSFPWLENDSQVIFDERDENLTLLYNFIESARIKGEGCLVHSLRGLSRACCVLSGYFMKKFKWTLYKTLEFLHSRRPDLEIRSSFFANLNKLEAKLSAKGGVLYNSWEEFNEEPLIREEELIIRNTYLNSRKAKPIYEEEGDHKGRRSLKKKMGLNWIDDVYRDKTKLVSEIKTNKLGMINRPKNRKGGIVKSILKVMEKNLDSSVLSNNNASASIYSTNNFSNNINNHLINNFNGSSNSSINYNNNNNNKNGNNNNNTAKGLLKSFASIYESKDKSYNTPITSNIPNLLYENKNINNPNKSSINNNNNKNLKDFYTSKTTSHPKEFLLSNLLDNQSKPKFSNPSTPTPETFENKHKVGRPLTPNPERDDLTNKTLNNLKEIESSKNLINQLINKNPLLLRKKVNNFLEDNSHKMSSETNISQEKTIDSNENNRSNSLPKKITNYNQKKRDTAEFLNRSENINREESEDNKGLGKNQDFNYQNLLFENGSLIKKKIQSKLLEDKTKKNITNINNINSNQNINNHSNLLYSKEQKHSFLNSAIGVGPLPAKRSNIVGYNNFDKRIENNNPSYVNNTNNDIKFNPTQNANLMSNLINLNLQLNKLNVKKEPENPNNTININNFNITTNQVNNININLQKMLPIRATFEIKDPNIRLAYNQSINIDIEKQNSENSFTNNKSPINSNTLYSKNSQNKYVNQPFQQRSISPMTKNLLNETTNKQSSGFGKGRLRSSSPGQNPGNYEERGAPKPKWNQFVPKKR